MSRAFERFILRFASAVVLLCPAFAVSQDDYPTKPIRFIIPFAPGGGSDILMRVLGAKMTEATGQPVIIDNRPGANGVIAASITAKAPADGYTVLLDTTSFVLNPLLRANLPYDPDRDFVPVVMPAWVTHIFAANPNSPKAVRDLDEMLAVMKASPGNFFYGSTGTGSTSHLAGEFLDASVGSKSTHVSYKGGNPALTALMAGDIHVVIGTVPLVMPHLRSGRLRAIAVTSPRRIAELPDVPAVAEKVPNYEANLWWAFFVPAGTPKPVVLRLNQEIVAALRADDVRQKLAPQGFNFVAGTPEEASAFVKAEQVKWEKIMRGAKITMD